MYWTKISMLALFLVIIFSVSVFGGHFGYTVEGVPQGGEIEGEPGLLGVVGWCVNAFGFFWHMISFQVDGVPDELGLVFIFMSLITVVILVSFFLIGGSG